MSIKDLADKMRSYGRGPDDVLVHMSKKELRSLQGLAQAAGGSLTVNPKTGLPEAGFLDSLLPTIIGAGVGIMTMNPYAGAAAGAAVGGAQAKSNDQDVLMGAAMGGLGGYGGSNLAAGLANTGANAAATQGMVNAVPEATLAQEAAVNAFGPVQAGAAQPLSAEAASQYTGAADLARADYTNMGKWDQLSQGASAAMDNPYGYVDALGGSKEATKTAGMAAAPMLYDYMTPKTGGGEDDGSGEKKEIPKYGYNANQTGNFYGVGGDYGTYERTHFDPTFTRMANGGIVALAQGGPAQPQGGIVALSKGDVVIPADVTAFAGNGSTDAGMAVLAKKMGAEPIKGPGDGLSDDIQAHIDGQQPARVANGEMVVRQPKNTKKLLAAIKNIRKQAIGTAKQVRPVNVDRALA
jgi:hypothetical protein